MVSARLNCRHTDSGYWVYFDLRRLFVRWNVALGHIYPAQEDTDAGFAHVSMFLSQRLKRGEKYLVLEMMLEERRIANFPNQVSRLKGLFVFETKEDAVSAAKTLNVAHFDSDCLSEVGCEDGHRKSKLDSNWITYFHSEGTEYPEDWIDRYWSGDPYKYPPLWELIVDGILTVWNMDLRQRVYNRLALELRCTFALRLGIHAFDLGYPIGRISIILVRHGDCIALRHTMYFEEAVAVQATNEIRDRFPERLQFIQPQQFADSEVFFIAPDFSSDDFCIVHRGSFPSCALELYKH